MLEDTHEVFVLGKAVAVRHWHNGDTAVYQVVPNTKLFCHEREGVPKLNMKDKSHKMD